MKEKHFYCRYSVPQRKYLFDNGVKYELCVLKLNNKKTM